MNNNTNDNDNIISNKEQFNIFKNMKYLKNIDNNAWDINNINTIFFNKIVDCKHIYISYPICNLTKIDKIFILQSNDIFKLNKFKDNEIDLFFNIINYDIFNIIKNK